MVSYAFHLASGATIQANVIESGTIKESLLAFNVLEHNVRKEINCDKLCEPINKVMAQVKRFKDVSNCCEPYTQKITLKNRKK